MTKRDRIKRARAAGKAGAGIPRGEASRENGKLGGRPRNPEIARIMQEHNCSRQYAYQILRNISEKP